MIVHVTDLALVKRMWPALAPMFARVTRHTNGCYEPEDVLAEILSGQQQLWVAWDGAPGEVAAAMTTSITNYPRRKAVRVVYIAGAKMQTWLDAFVLEVEKFAAREGATLIEGFFRKGWGRVWPGARECGVGLVKEIKA